MTPDIRQEPPQPAGSLRDHKLVEGPAQLKMTITFIDGLNLTYNYTMKYFWRFPEAKPMSRMHGEPLNS